VSLSGRGTWNVFATRDLKDLQHGTCGIGRTAWGLENLRRLGEAERVLRRLRILRELESFVELRDLTATLEICHLDTLRDRKFEVPEYNFEPAWGVILEASRLCKGVLKGRGAERRHRRRGRARETRHQMSNNRHVPVLMAVADFSVCSESVLGSSSSKSAFKFSDLHSCPTLYNQYSFNWVARFLQPRSVSYLLLLVSIQPVFIYTGVGIPGIFFLMLSLVPNFSLWAEPEASDTRNGRRTWLQGLDFCWIWLDMILMPEVECQKCTGTDIKSTQPEHHLDLCS
jgi:hypothetical protein